MKWGYSSAGRAPALHAGGQRFDPLSPPIIVTLSSYLRLQAVKNTGLFAILGMMIGSHYLCSLTIWKQAEKLRDISSSLRISNYT